MGMTMIGCLVATISWFMAIVGLILAFVFPFFEGNPSPLGSVIFGIIALAGLFLLLYLQKVVGNKDESNKK